MIEFYWQIKLAHVVTVIASGSIFFLRGVGVLMNMSWPAAAPVRYLTYAIDTVLLTAALVLAAILQQYPFVNSWLTAKVMLLVAYIGLGTFALKRARTRPAKAVFFVLALAVYFYIASVARSRDPLGVLRLLGV